MNIYKIHMSCDNIKSTACYYIYNMESVYCAEGYPAEAKTFWELDIDVQEAAVKRFEVQEDGHKVKVLLG